MKKFRQWRRWLPVMAGLVIIAGVVRHLPDHEPRFEGRKLSAWLDDSELGEAEINRAVRAIGTNAIPQLESWLLQKPSMLESSLRWLGRKSAYVSFDYQPSLDANFRAMRGFFALGELAEPAVPWLEAGATKKNADFEFYLTALAISGPRGAQALDRLVPTFSERETRTYIHALAFGVKWSPELVLRLEKFLADPNPQVRLQTLWTIREFRGRCPSKLYAAIQERALIEPDKDLRDTALFIATEVSNEVSAASINTHRSIDL